VLLFFFFLRIVIAQGWYIGMGHPNSLSDCEAQ
jgi:hypothetical protein